jgi:hypothetical protein
MGLQPLSGLYSPPSKGPIFFSTPSSSPTNSCF